MKITSYGAAGEVTGSKNLLEINGNRILLDCGMFQGHRHEADQKNRHLPVPVESIHAVVLSHAHIDHSGLLPMLAKYGYRGSVYSTHATRDLCSLMLQDSAHIQKRDAEWLSRKHMTFIPPLYQAENVSEIMRHFISMPYDRPFLLLPGVTITFREAGHVLGSAMVEIEYEEEGRQRRFIFSGDIGRKGMSILNDPWEPLDADTVLMEGTYGGREHGTREAVEEKLVAVIETAVERKGKIIVPSFALERTQEIIYTLKRLELRNAIPDIPVYVDSPLTVGITEIFRLHTDSYDKEFQQLMYEAGDPFELRRIRYIRPVAESMQLNKLEGPAMIIAAAGMCEHGRVVHHLKNNVEDPRNIVLIVGFQAAHTLGRRIVDRQRELKILGVKRQLNAQVKVLNEFSAHAGHTELVAFGARFRDCAENILLVHGELEPLQTLKAALHEQGVKHVRIQEEGVAVEV